MLKQIRLAALIGTALAASSVSASAVCASYPHTLTNGTTASATDVMDNFNCAALTSGSSINGLTLTGTTTFPGSSVVTSTGAIGIQTSSPSAALDVSATFGTYNPTGGSIARLTNPSSTGQSPLDFFINGTQRGRMRVDYAGNVNYAAFGGGHYFTVGGDSGVGIAGVSIASNGSVGIGTGSPGFPLDVSGSAAGNAYTTRLKNSSSTGYTSFRLYNDQNSASRGLEIDYSGSAYATVLAGGGPTGESAVVNVTGAYPLVLATSNAARVTILSGGNVGVGTISPSYTLHVNGSVAGTSAYNNLSDERLKKDIRPITDALGIVTRLQGVEFSWRTPQERTVGVSIKLPVGEPQIGFIAQDLGKVLPQAVSVAIGKDAIMSVAESKVVPVLVEAVKELSQENASLREANQRQTSELNDIQSKIAELDRRIGTRSARN